MSFPKYPAYKDSGVEWLGEVPAHWSITPLKFSASCNDTVLPESTDDDYEIEYVEISDVNEVSGITGSASYKFSDAPSRARRMLQDGDVLISTVRTYLRAIAPVVNPPENLIASTGFAVVRPRKGILDGAFLGYLLRAEWWISEVIARSVGVSYPAINASDLIGLNIPVPALQEQTQIARFLDHETARIDALIEEQQRLIELLKEKRQAVISHAVTKGLDPTVPMKDSGVEWLGEVPAHWRVVRLRHCLVDALTYGANEPSDEANLEHPRYIRITDLNDDGTLSAETYKSLPPEKAEPYMLEEGDVLFARSGATVGKSFLYSREYGPACYAGYLIRARVNKRALIPMYLWMCTQSRQYEQFIGESNIQATIQNVSAEKYGNMWIALPELEEQERILAELEIQLSQFKSLMETSVGALVLLQERRSALISAAVTGKIDVRGWQPPASIQAPEAEQEAV